MTIGKVTERGLYLFLYSLSAPTKCQTGWPMSFRLPPSPPTPSDWIWKRKTWWSCLPLKTSKEKTYTKNCQGLRNEIKCVSRSLRKCSQPDAKNAAGQVTPSNTFCFQSLHVARQVWRYWAATQRNLLSKSEVGVLGDALHWHQEKRPDPDDERKDEQTSGHLGRARTNPVEHAE